VPRPRRRGTLIEDRQVKRGASWTVDAADAGTRLDKFLAAEARAGSRGRAFDALARGKVFVNDREATADDAALRVTAGDVVRLWADRPGSAKRRTSLGDARDLPIVFEDNAIVVLDKPAGVLAVPLPPERASGGRSVFEDLAVHLRRRGRHRPFVVHRIDRDTSGLVLFAKTSSAQDALKSQFKRREPERVYQAIVYGHPQPASGTWRDALAWDGEALIQKETSPRDPRAKEAISHYRVVEAFAAASLIEVRLVSGRRNQIRIQARLRGHTLVGEQRYVYGPESLRPIAFPRQALHAARLGFRHPVTDRTMIFEAPLPEDMQSLLARLRRQAPRRTAAPG
jgi:23S rRNA pseudouridine1911/1915/1917 synthase